MNDQFGRISLTNLKSWVVYRKKSHDLITLGPQGHCELELRSHCPFWMRHVLRSPPAPLVCFPHWCHLLGLHRHFHLRSLLQSVLFRKAGLGSDLTRRRYDLGQVMQPHPGLTFFIYKMGITAPPTGML